MECIVCNGEFYEDHRIAWFRLSDPTQRIVYFAMYSSLGSYIFSSAVSNPQLFPSGRKGETVQRLRDPKQLGEALGTQGLGVVSPFTCSSAPAERQVYILVCCMNPLQETEWDCGYFSAVNALPRGSTSLPFHSAKGVVIFPFLCQAASCNHLIGNISRSTQCQGWQPTSPLYATELLN